MGVDRGRRELSSRFRCFSAVFGDGLRSVLVRRFVTGSGKCGRASSERFESGHEDSNDSGRGMNETCPLFSLVAEFSVLFVVDVIFDVLFAVLLYKFLRIHIQFP